MSSIKGKNAKPEIPVRKIIKHTKRCIFNNYLPQPKEAVFNIPMMTKSIIIKVIHHEKASYHHDMPSYLYLSSFAGNYATIQRRWFNKFQ